MRIRPNTSRPPWEQGFTMIELVVLIVVLGIVTMVIVGAARPLSSAPTTQADMLAAHLRTAQSKAMKSGSNWGLTCQSSVCWLYQGTDSAGTPVALPGETGATITLAGNKASSTNFDVYFDQFGIPYSEASGAKLASDLTITVSSTADASQSKTVTLTAETGYVP